MAVADFSFDHRRLAAKRRRARRIARADAGFLVDLCAREMADRLHATNREFRRGIDLLTPTPALAEALRRVRPELEIERIDDEMSAARTTGRDDLGLETGGHDLAVSALGLHWSNDLPGTLVQIRRALKPDGLFMAALPGEGTLAELRESLIVAEASMSAGASLRIDPFVDVRQAGALMQRAGFALPVADVEQHVVRYASVAALIGDLRAMGATSARAGQWNPLPRAIAERLETVYAERFSDADGRLRASFNVIYLTGWTPHENQQKPLRPGSAEVSLADYLGRKK
jgi:SAM-dependent methyltransferase